MVVLVMLALALALVGCSRRHDGEPAGPPATSTQPGRYSLGHTGVFR